MKLVTLAALLLSIHAAVVHAAPSYNITTLGFDDLEHTRDDGYRDSSPLIYFAVNELGHVAGRSIRYNGGSVELGQSLWLYNGATTLNVGLIDNEHTRDDGFKFSNTDDAFRDRPFNQAGQLFGYSQRFDSGSADLGQSAWVFNGTTTVSVGLTGAEHTGNDGARVSRVNLLNQTGQAAGYSVRYNGGSTTLGLSFWHYDGTTTTEIGLTGPDHTRSDGRRSGQVVSMNEAGQVAGHSERYVGAIDGVFFPGKSAWLFDGATTIEIGLTDEEHTSNNSNSFGKRYSDISSHLNEAGHIIGNSRRFGEINLGTTGWFYNGEKTVRVGPTGSEFIRSDGYRSSSVSRLNDAGQIIGSSARFHGSTSLGNSAWRYDGGNIVQLGLTGPEHTRNDGYQASHFQLGADTFLNNLNATGQVTGYSERYNGASQLLGYSTWFYDGATTIQIGLTGPEHTSSAGSKTSFARETNEAGQVLGFSVRFIDNLIHGRSAWLYEGATTIDIGLVGAEHTRSDGFKYSDASYFNETGQVGGVSRRYNGGETQLGQDAWLYDPALNQTFSLQLSARSDGYAFSQVHYLGEDGMVLGSYALYDAMDNFVGNRPFYFTVADGLHDLGSLVNGGLLTNGWDYLSDAVHDGNGQGQILAYAVRTPQPNDRVPVLLTPQPVPEPSTLILLALGLLAMIRTDTFRCRDREQSHR